MNPPFPAPGTPGGGSRMPFIRKVQDESDSDSFDPFNPMQKEEKKENVQEQTGPVLVAQLVKPVATSKESHSNGARPDLDIQLERNVLPFLEPPTIAPEIEKPVPLPELNVPSLVVHKVELSPDSSFEAVPKPTTGPLKDAPTEERTDAPLSEMISVIPELSVPEPALQPAESLVPFIPVPVAVPEPMPVPLMEPAKEVGSLAPKPIVQAIPPTSSFDRRSHQLFGTQQRLYQKNQEDGASVNLGIGILGQGSNWMQVQDYVVQATEKTQKADEESASGPDAGQQTSGQHAIQHQSSTGAQRSPSQKTLFESQEDIPPTADAEYLQKETKEITPQKPLKPVKPYKKSKTEASFLSDSLIPLPENIVLSAIEDTNPSEEHDMAPPQLSPQTSHPLIAPALIPPSPPPAAMLPTQVPPPISLAPFPPMPQLQGPFQIEIPQLVPQPLVQVPQPIQKQQQIVDAPPQPPTNKPSMHAPSEPEPPKSKLSLFEKLRDAKPVQKEDAKVESSFDSFEPEYAANEPAMPPEIPDRGFPWRHREVRPVSASEFKQFPAGLIAKRIGRVPDAGAKMLATALVQDISVAVVHFERLSSGQFQ